MLVAAVVDSKARNDHVVEVKSNHWVQEWSLVSFRMRRKAIHQRTWPSLDRY